MSTRWKNAVRLVEAFITPRTASIVHGGRTLRFTRSLFWNDAYQALFDGEIAPYFKALRGLADPRSIVDAGAASGQFAVAACVSFPTAIVHAFEPSARQRALLRRNARRNGCAQRIDIHPAGLWDREGELPFRTHGSISAFQDAGALPETLAFTERVAVTTLDRWVEGARVPHLDLVKMDIEGSEIEALLGATHVLRRYRPTWMIQAYHARDGVRTFERCAALLEKHAYRCVEIDPPSGMLWAVPEGS